MSKKLETIDIKGKQYVTVNERLKYFRENFKDWRLITEITELTANKVIFKASILNPKGEVVANGHACEVAGSSFINKTSHIENAETSAWGRALGNMGIGVDSSVCSADEVANAIIQQTKPKGNGTNWDKVKPVSDELNQEAYKQIERRKTAISKYGILLEMKNPTNKDDMLKTFKTKNIDEMTKLYKELQES
jgi:hypothetical protein